MTFATGSDHVHVYVNHLRDVSAAIARAMSGSIVQLTPLVLNIILNAILSEAEAHARKHSFVSPCQATHALLFRQN